MPFLEGRPLGVILVSTKPPSDRKGCCRSLDGFVGTAKGFGMDAGLFGQAFWFD